MSESEHGCRYVIRGASGEVFGAAIPDAGGGSVFITVDRRNEAPALCLSLWNRDADGKPVPLASLDVPAGCLAGLEHFLRSARARSLPGGGMS